MQYLCNLCPRKCNVIREDAFGDGFCKMPSLPIAAKATVHMWEEPCISGTRGSGAIFFTGCNLKCIFCQNYNISHNEYGKQISVERLTDIFYELQSKGVHNINLVTPTHYVFPIIKALEKYKSKNDALPVVYNCGGYENVSTLKMLNGLIDIYLPDLKYFSDEKAIKYSAAPDYFNIAAEAIDEMYSQTGRYISDDENVLKKGLVVRHMIMPRGAGDAIKIIDYLNQKYADNIYISIMSQYIPTGIVSEYPEINRKINYIEYNKVINHIYNLDIQNGFIQDMISADLKYIPDFNLEGI